MGETEGSVDTLTALPGGMQESGAGILQGGVRDGGSDTRKAPSMAADKEGARGSHGARPGQGGGKGGRQENVGGKTSGLRGDNGGREASGVAHKSSGVGGE